MNVDPAELLSQLLDQFTGAGDKLTAARCSALADSLATLGLEADDQQLRQLVTAAIDIEMDRLTDEPASARAQTAALAGARGFFQLDGGPSDREFTDIQQAHRRSQVTVSSQICRYSWARWQELRVLHPPRDTHAPNEKNGRERKQVYARALTAAIVKGLGHPDQLRSKVLAGHDEPLWSSPAHELLDTSTAYERDVRVEGELHVIRTVEPKLWKLLLDTERPWPRALVGEAGSGKSTLLWSIAASLRTETDIRPLLLSAAWLLRHLERQSVQQFLEVLDEFRRAGERVIILLDTADLMLHEESDRQALLRLVDALHLSGIPSLYATRPQEAAALNHDALRRHDLQPYDDAEIDRAVPLLVARYCGGASTVDVGDRIRQATARGLPVADVCRSPLLLRMLFDLAAPLEPELEDVDVTRLFNAYWDRRILRDARTSAEVAMRATADTNLAGVAGAAGIGLLAAGLPELPFTVLHDVTTAAARADPASTSDGLDVLRERGVIVSVGEQGGFFHQTMFEFAAAKGILGAASPNALDLVAVRTIAEQADLFVGAVLEQLLILAGTNPLWREAGRRATANLAAAENQAVQGIALVAWAHHPGLLPEPRETLRQCGDAAVRRACRTLPTIAARPAGEVISQLIIIWQTTASPEVGADVLKALARIALRSPEAVAEAIEYLDPLSVITSEQEAAGRVAAFLEVLNAISPVARTYVRASLVSLIGSRVTASHVAFDYLAEQWLDIGDADLLDEITRTLADGSRSGPNAAMDFAVILTAEWIAAEAWSGEGGWPGFVATILDPDPAASNFTAMANVVALGSLLAALGTSNDLIDHTIGAFLAACGGRLRDTLIQIVLRNLLDGTGPASRRFVDHANRQLVTIGYSAQRGGLSDVETALLELLTQSGLPDGSVSRLLPPHLGTRDWLATPHLLRLVPLAAAEGMPSALRILQHMANRPQDFTDEQIEQIYGTLTMRMIDTPEVSRLVVDIALATGRTSDLISLVTALERLGPQISAAAGPLVEHARVLIDGDSEQQRQGAALLGAVMSKAHLRMPWTDLRQLLENIGNPEHRNPIAGGLWAQAEMGSLPEQLDYLAEFVSVDFEHDPPIAPADSAHTVSPTTLQTCAQAMLRMLALRSDSAPQHWPTVRTLGLYDVGSSEVFVTGERFVLVLEYLNKLHPENPASTTELLLDYLHRLAEGNFYGFSRTLWHRELTAAVRAACASGLTPIIERLIDVANLLDDDVAEAVIATIAERHYARARTSLHHLAAEAASARRREFIIDLLRTQDRRFGTRAFSELLAETRR